MTTSPLSDAFAHHVWATTRQLDACATLDESQLATTVPGTYGSILDTLRHIVDGDVFYLDILRGGTPEPFDKDASDIPTLRSVMEAHRAAWEEILVRYQATDPTTDIVEYEDNGYETHAPLGIRLGQVLYHGTDHRSQVNTALTSLGIEPPAIEGWDIAREDGRMSTIETTGAGKPVS
ncbi:MAG: DinB family protein [Chloroflexi bacterium]|nr:DinB family protein [Chloroflexota bacterium]